MAETIFRIIMPIMMLFCAACSESATSNYNYDALKAREPRHCPDGARIEYQPWGPNGLMAICKLNHGPFIAAENGHVVLEGENRMGRPTGTWTWFDKSGKVEKTVNCGTGRDGGNNRSESASVAC
jgi:hypothetical protein